MSDERPMTMAEAAERNVRLGWCPCGDTDDADCECGITRLAALQGKFQIWPHVRPYRARANPSDKPGYSDSPISRDNTAKGPR